MTTAELMQHATHSLVVAGYLDSWTQKIGYDSIAIECESPCAEVLLEYGAFTKEDDESGMVANNNFLNLSTHIGHKVNLVVGASGIEMHCYNCLAVLPLALGNALALEQGVANVSLPKQIMQRAYDALLGVVPEALDEEPDELVVLRRTIYYALHMGKEDTGVCDVCWTPYLNASREDHCIEEGVCWDHCANVLQHEIEQQTMDDDEDGDYSDPEGN